MGILILFYTLVKIAVITLSWELLWFYLRQYPQMKPWQLLAIHVLHLQLAVMILRCLGWLETMAAMGDMTMDFAFGNFLNLDVSILDLRKDAC